MSTIDPSTIDPTKPVQGEPQTASVRANEAATQANFAAAKADIEALETADGNNAKLNASNTFQEGPQYFDSPTGNASMVVTDTPLTGTASASMIGARALLDLRASTNLGGGDPTNFLVSFETEDVTSALIKQRDVTTGNPVVRFLEFTKGGGVQVGSSVPGGDQGEGSLNAKALYVGGDPVLRNVVEDASPQLGGNLETKGNLHRLTRSDDSLQAVIGPSVSELGGYFAYSYDGSFNTLDGAIGVSPAKVDLYGSVVQVHTLKHTNPAGYEQLVANQDGVVFGISPPAPGWSDAVTDTGFYNPKSGGLGVWVQVSGLTTTVQENVAAGARMHINYSLYVQETSGNRSGNLEVGFGVNGAQPTVTAVTHLIQPGFASYISDSTFGTDGYTATDTVDIWVRVTQEDNVQYAPQVDGSTNEHDATLWVDGDPGGGGATTFLGLTDTPSSYAGQSGKLVSVNGGATALEFTDPPTGSGDVTITGNTNDDEVMLGAAAAKGIKNSGTLFSNIARRDVTNDFQGLCNFRANIDVNDGAGSGQLFVGGNTLAVAALSNIQLTNVAALDTLTENTIKALTDPLYTPATLTADGDLLSHNGTQEIRLPLGTDGQVLVARPGGAAGAKIAWETPPGGGATQAVFTTERTWVIDGDITVASAGLPFWVSVGANETLRIIAYRHKLNVGTASVRMRIDAAINATLSATTTKTNTAANVAVTDFQEVTWDVESASADASGLSVQVIFEHTVTLT